MSLTSRVFGLFSTTANEDSNTTATTNSSYSTSSANRVYASDHAVKNEIIPGVSRSQTVALEEDEPRPPYHHVRPPLNQYNDFDFQRARAKTVTNAVLGNAGWWNGWLCW